MTRFTFNIAATDGAARTGTITTPRGEIRTPAFMPVGTAATVKAMKPKDVRSSGADIILGNTYHLMLRPGAERVAKLGGLHRFMGWERPILTDSGGFQVFSLGHLRKVDEEGVTFRSHIDGSEHRLTPELAMQVQRELEDKASKVVDATCPFVTRVQKLAARAAEQDRHVVVVGNPDHPEMIGVKGYAPDHAFVMTEVR